MELFGVKWVGINAENGRKLVLSVAFLVAVMLVTWLLRSAVHLVLGVASTRAKSVRFWLRQALSVLATFVIIIGVVSIWFDDPTRLSTAFGLMSAGLAFALQKVITSIAGYFVILRGSTFTVGDRISMGGVRGDVIRLGFIQTTIMEMGQPPSVQSAEPAMWVKSRQFTGRIVSVSNSQIFNDPVYNYTRDFPFLWEELSLPITYKADRGRVESMLLEAAKRYAIDPDTMLAQAKASLKDKFGVEPIDLAPRVFFRITDNWLELTVRFVVETHGIRNVKDAMSRFIVDALDAAGIGIASATYDIVGFPPIEVRTAAPPA